MAEQVEKLLDAYGLTDQVEVDFTEQYVLINLNGALLFEAGEVNVREEAYPILEKIGIILNNYQNNLIEIEGHTDNVPVTDEWYGSNDVLSMYRALYVADYLRENTDILPSHFKSSGRGEYDPIADNSTAEGRAKNRRVEIKIYNSLNSDM
jgi:chemotaxis protein MotB